MKNLIIILTLCFSGCVGAKNDEATEGKAWDFQPQEIADVGPVDELDITEGDVEDDVLMNREFDVDGCWNADWLTSEQSRPIDFSSFRQDACVMGESRTGYYQVSIPAGFRLQLNETNYPRPTLLNFCAEISPQFCQTRRDSERVTQNNSNQAKDVVLEYFEGPLDPIALVQLYPLADNISCNSPQALELGEESSADMRQGGAWDFNPCRADLQNATQFYQIDVPLGGNYFVEIAANDPNNRSIRAQFVNVHNDSFSCENPVENSCFPVSDLAVANDSLLLFRLDASWGGGRDPARAIIAISGSTTLSDSGYSIELTDNLEGL